MTLHDENRDLSGGDEDDTTRPNPPARRDDSADGDICPRCGRRVGRDDDENDEGAGPWAALAREIRWALKTGGPAYYRLVALLVLLFAVGIMVATILGG